MMSSSFRNGRWTVSGLSESSLPARRLFCGRLLAYGKLNAAIGTRID
jgi:hypothetical protein